MAKENCGGSIAKEYDGFFLRNDSEIRKGADMEPNETYSLFSRESIPQSSSICWITRMGHPAFR
jgi:hypothetical protein